MPDRWCLPLAHSLRFAGQGWMRFGIRLLFSLKLAHRPKYTEVKFYFQFPPNMVWSTWLLFVSQCSEMWLLQVGHTRFPIIDILVALVESGRSIEPLKLAEEYGYAAQTSLIGLKLWCFSATLLARFSAFFAPWDVSWLHEKTTKQFFTSDEKSTN